MNRLFGKSKPKVAAPTLDDASKSMDARGGTIDDKVKKLDDELLRYKQQLSRMKPGPAKQQLQQRALRVLQQKKMYGKQRDTLYSQQFNIDQAKFAGESVKDNLTTIAAMKEAQKSMKVDMKRMKLDQVEDLHDDMSDMLEDADEVNEIMGRAYGSDTDTPAQRTAAVLDRQQANRIPRPLLCVRALFVSVPEELDESDLMDELDAMEGELEQETDSSHEVPPYLLNAATAAKQSSASSSQPAAGRHEQKSAYPYSEVEVDEFGLPAVPVRSLEA